jgi:hypothetical protein
MIQIKRQIRRQPNQMHDRRNLEQPPNRINPKPPILIKLRIELELPRLHLRQRPQRDHLIRLIAIQPIPPHDRRPLRIGLIQNDRPIPPQKRMRRHIRRAPRIPTPIRRHRQNLFPCPRRAFPKQIRIDQPRRQPPPDPRKKNPAPEQEQPHQHPSSSLRTSHHVRSLQNSSPHPESPLGPPHRAPSRS